MEQFVQFVLIPGLAHGAILGLIAIGFNVLYATTDVLNFGHGQLLMVLPTAILVAVGAGLPIFAAYIVGIIVLGIISLGIEKVAVRPFMHSHKALTWILSTLGASVILTELLTFPFDGESQNFPYGFSSRGIEMLGFRISIAEIASIAAVVIVFGLLQLFYRYTRVGLELRAMGEDLNGAQAIGISRASSSRSAMLLSAAVAGITGILLVSTQIVTPGLGFTYTFAGFVAVTMGGLGSIPGGLIGGFVVGLVSQSAAVYFGALASNATVFALLIVVYLVRPHGIFGKAPVREV